LRSLLRLLKLSPSKLNALHMKSIKKSLNVEKETKASGKTLDRDRQNKTIEKMLGDKKTEAATGQTQYPNHVGYHGTDDEKELNPEE
jgi:hypothetical protein